MSDLDRLQSLLASGASCLWIVTDEEEHALRLIRDAAMTAQRPICQWDIIRGIRDGLVAPPATEEGTEHPAAALYRFSQREDGSVCVMLDLIAHLPDERTLRAARDCVAAFESQRERALPAGTLILVDHREDLPEILRSSATRLDLTPPDDAEIENILVATLRRENQHHPIQINISKRSLATIVQNLRGLSRGQIERTISAAVADDHTFSPDDLPGILSRKRQILEGEGLLEFVEAPTSMDQIGGLGRLKQWLKDRERALSPEASQFGVDAPRGILMLGVQGAGKSLCAKAIATAWKRPLLRLDPGVLYDRYIGESERRLRTALKQAGMMAPAVLWIDEIEKAFASAASRSIDGGLSQRMFGTLLTWMQEHDSGIFLAATANDVEALPPELLRKGRFDEIFFVDLPSEASRRQIFEIHLKKRGRDPKKFDCAALAKAASGFSGAEIEQAVIAALNSAFSSGVELGMVQLLEAAKGSPPLSVTMAERVADLRKWAAGRCVPAE